MCIVRILTYWYASQQVYVRWRNTYSDGFATICGVRQGSVLSPYLFCVYMDDLSSDLNELNIGCILGNQKINHIMCAYDLLLLSPSATGLSTLIKTTELFGAAHDILFNSDKSKIMIFTCKLLDKNTVSDFTISGCHIPLCNSFTYLGHILCVNMKDDSDIERQCKRIYAQGNTLLRKFGMCSEAVKCTLFQTFCTPMYTAHLWLNHTKAVINKLYIAYNNIGRYLFDEPKYPSGHSSSIPRGI